MEWRGWEHEMVKLVAGLVMGVNPMVEEESDEGEIVGRVKTWRGTLVVA